MLTVYQETVRSLLDHHDYPGVTAEELELFKSQFRTSAFTCRLKSCPRATLGFESEKHCLQHEMTHIRRLRCTAADCKFPPFVSPQALKLHISKYHSHSLPPKSIRGIQVSSNTTGSLVYQRDSPDTRQNKNLPQNAGQKAQEGRAKRKFPVGNDENPSSHKLSSADSSTTSKPSTSSTTEFPPLNYCSFEDCLTLTDGSYGSLCLEHLRQSLTYNKKGSDSQSTVSAPITLRTIVEISGEHLTPPDEPSVGRNFPSVTPLKVLTDENSEQMTKLQPPEGTDAYAAPTLTNGQTQSPTSNSAAVEPNLSPSGPPSSMTPGVPIERSEDGWDVDGEKKICPSGRLIGSREYRCRIFPWPNERGDFYMLGTDCMHKLGYHFTEFMRRGGSLPSISLNAVEKSNLKAQNILRNAHIYDDISVVKARHVFRQFGHLVVEGGRPIHDDYWVADAREQLKDKIMKQGESSLWENDQIKKRFGIVAGRSVVESVKLVFGRHLDAKATEYGGIENIPDDEIARSMDNAFIHLQDKYHLEF